MLGILDNDNPCPCDKRTVCAEHKIRKIKPNTHNFLIISGDKPSERIEEIHEKFCKEAGCHPESEMANTYGYRELAIIQFLDEQHAQRSKPLLGE